MAKKSKQLIGECVHCGICGPVTSDHISPKGLFAPPRPELITVPSCKSCNLGASKDDEYFRAMLSFHDTAGNHPDARQVRDKVFRGLDRPESTGLRHKIANATREVSVISPNGLFIGRSLAYDVDLIRFDRVVRRTLTGLYYKENGYRLPDGYIAEVYSEEGLRDMSASAVEEMQRELIRPALTNVPRTIGNNVMRYWFALASDHPHVSGWVFQFYERINFIGVTLPVGRAGG
jgi:hypothetical protein